MVREFILFSLSSLTCLQTKLSSPGFEVGQGICFHSFPSPVSTGKKKKEKRSQLINVLFKFVFSFLIVCMESVSPLTLDFASMRTRRSIELLLLFGVSWVLLASVWKGSFLAKDR